MSSVTRGGFRNELQGGVDLSSPDIQENLEGTGLGLDDVRTADLDGDGFVAGRRELDQLFKVVDGLDSNKRAASFEAAGPALQAFNALKAARRDLGSDIVNAAAARVASEGPNYASDKAPTSPHPQLSGNDTPGVTRLDWLENRNKCNQFVGDALTQAGVEAPTVKMANGSLHFQSAEKWPTRTDLFERVTDPADIRPGDVLVRDYPGSGESSAHVEVVTGTHPLRSTGAHSDGAYESENRFFNGTTPNVANRSFSDASGNEVYILRPKKALE